jgi:hypothetical protein
MYGSPEWTKLELYLFGRYWNQFRMGKNAPSMIGCGLLNFWLSSAAGRWKEKILNTMEKILDTLGRPV